jgi:PAS domain S-box-containing protein
MTRRRAGSAAAAAIATGAGQRIMQDLETVLTTLRNEEWRLLALRNADAKQRLSQAKSVLIFGDLVGLLIVVGAFVAVQRDSLRRRAIEEELRESEEKYRMLLDGVRDYAIFMMDPQGDVLSWNAGAERTKGYAAGVILGRNFACFFPPDAVRRGRPAELLRMTAASGRQEEQALRVRRDGSQFLAHVTLAALHDRAGKLRGFSEISHDLSQSKESEVRYRGLLEAAPDAMVVVNTDGEIVLLNVQAEKQFGYRRDELLGQPVKRLIPEGFAERLIADGTRSAAEALAQQIGTGIELIGLRKDGTEFPIEIMLSPLEGAEGILVTAAIRDISTRKAAEAQLLQKVEELKRSNEELGQFAYIASHDLQEPLRMVASYTQLLSRRYKGRLDSDADEFIAFAVDGASRMQRLIQDLLAYSRVGTKGRELAETSSERALAQALVNLRGAVEASGAAVTHDSLPNVLADETSWCSCSRTSLATRSSTRGRECPRSMSRPSAKRGGKGAGTAAGTATEGGSSRCVTTGWESTRSISSGSSACSSACTSGRSSPAPGSVWQSAARSPSAMAAPSPSSRSPVAAPPSASRWPESQESSECLGRRSDAPRRAAGRRQPGRCAADPGGLPRRQHGRSPAGHGYSPARRLRRRGGDGVPAP